MELESRSSIAEVPLHVAISSHKFVKQNLKFSAFSITNVLVAF
jgi:hypothetical protein